MRSTSVTLLAIMSCLLVGSQVFAADRLITVEDNDLDAVKGVVNAIEAYGGRVKIVVPPHFIIADLPAAIEGRVLMTPQVADVHNGELMAGLEVPPAPDRRPLINDVLVPDDHSLLMKPPGARFFDSSEFMLGTVTLGVVMAESDGSIDPETEDWTQTEKDNVTSEIINGLNWYANKANWRPLTFYAVFVYDVPTGYEPIKRPGPSRDETWVLDCLAYLGNATSLNYVNKIRDSLETDWGVVTYIADSSNDADNMFSNGTFAYAYLGGPNFIMTYGNDGWGIGNMDAVMAHELGHSFFALDEYSGGGEGCTARSGYLWYENQNSCVPSGCGGCASNSSFCIMRSVGLGVAQVCTYTKGQIGWIDSDGDGICDINDTYPETELYTYAPDPCSSFTPTYAGSSYVGYLPNLNERSLKQRDITLNRIEKVEYRVDGGAWQEATPNDGAWDGGKEGYHFTTEPLSADTHIIEARAVHTLGNSDTTFAADTLTIDPGSGIDAGVTNGLVFVDASPNPFDARVEVRYNIPGEYGTGVAVSMRVYDVRGREVASLMECVRSPGPGRLSWDATFADGRLAPSGIYFIDLMAGNEKVVRKLVVAR
jgi:hypothetical protein